MNTSANYDGVSENIKTRAFLLYWNELTAQYLLPNTIVLAIYLSIGLAGNIAVILVYQFGLHKKTDGRFFIVPLAWIDTAALIVTAAFNLTKNTKSIIFPGHGACKLLMYLSYVTTSTSLFLLNVIAVQRYLKICKPFGPQMNQRSKRFLVFICAILSIVLYIPLLFYYGNVEISNQSLGNVSGNQCNKLPGSPAQLKGLLIFQGVGFFVSSSSVVTIIVLYTCITIATLKQLKAMKVITGNNFIVTTLETPEQTHAPKIQVNFQSVTSDTEISLGTSTQINEPKEKLPTKTAKRKSTFKISFMFMIISVVTFVSCLTSWTLIVIETKNPAFWKNLPPTAFHICLVLRRLYMINHFCNPFVYGAFDCVFRKKMKNVFCKN